MQLIKSHYGRTCHACKKFIHLKWRVQPLCRQKGDSGPVDPNGNPWGYFHASCWCEYQKVKNNKRRRVRYAERRVEQLDQQPALDNGPIAAAIEDAPQNVPAVAAIQDSPQNGPAIAAIVGAPQNGPIEGAPPINVEEPKGLLPILLPINCDGSEGNF